MACGILNIHKPAGITSHDVVNAIRRLVGIRKIGHAGTLDPMATGVLVLCLGRATRLSEYLAASEKAYLATVRFGIETDTFDADGVTVSSSPATLQRAQVLDELRGFQGAISQVPPMYSAVKKRGQPLYKLARKGIQVERDPREAHISHIALTDWSPPDISLEVVCSAGTYVRVLAHDLGQKLGCGAHLTGLVRTRSGRFSLGEAVPLQDLTQENWTSYLQPMEVAVGHFPALTLDAATVSRLVQGQAILRQPAHPIADLARVEDQQGRFVALVKPSPDGTEWLPHKVFA